MSLVPSIINNGESSSVIRGSSSGGNHSAGTIINNGESSSAIRGSSSGGNHLAGKKAATTRQRGNKNNNKNMTDAQQASNCFISEVQYKVYFKENNML